MTLTDTQLAEIRAYVAVAIARTAYSFPPLSVMMTDAADDLLAHIASLESQLSTIRKEATDAERERCALIADDFERTAESFGGAHAKIAEGTAWGIAQAIRAPTGDEGK